jgi:hypothetical protein
MRQFKSVVQAQRFLSNHAEVYDLFNLGRHLMAAKFNVPLQPTGSGRFKEQVESVLGRKLGSEVRGRPKTVG